MIRLRYDEASGEVDVVFDEDGALATDHELVTAILVSLFVDRRVLPGEVPEGVDLGGWWGETFPAVVGDDEGSRLWTLYAKGRADALTAQEARGHAEEALAWLVADGEVETLTVSAAAIDGVIVLSIRADEVRLTFRVT